LNSSTVKAKWYTVSYATLEAVVAEVTEDTSKAYTTILTNLLDPAYLQTLYSNYGLLQALSFVSAQPLWDENQNVVQPGANNSLTTGITYASWKALVPSVFTWSPKLIGSGTVLTDTHEVFVLSSHVETLSSKTLPSQLNVFDILQADSDKFYSMFADIESWQTATKSPTGQFFSVCPIFISAPEVSSDFLTAVWVITWSLTDTNKHPMSGDLAASLFGIGDPNIVLTPFDQNNPLAAAGYGWYYQIANGAVTTPFDAFMNWGAGVSSYSPQILVAQLPQQGKLYSVIFEESVFGGDDKFAAAAAADTPPTAIVTLEPSGLDFGAVTIGQTITVSQSAVLTNNQKEPLQNITVTNDYTSEFAVSEIPTGLVPGDSATIDVSFWPSGPGIQSGKITVSAKGQYGPILLTLEFFGTGVSST
jgi:hypothetical protein